MIDHNELRDRVIYEEGEVEDARGRECAAAICIIVAFVAFGLTCYGGFSIVY